MILKVPIYVEVEKVLHPEALPPLLEELGRGLTRALRQEDIRKYLPEPLKMAKSPEFGSFKIVTKEKALEYLRLKK
jgi:preprotein translocase subunit Sec63